MAFLASGVDVILAAGGNTIDPLDPLLLALSDVGAEMIHFGAPSHPGSMFWLAQAGDTPIVNLASCSMYSKATVADLVLPLVMTGKQVRRSDIVEIGYGGLLERDMAFRFPDYAADLQRRGDESKTAKDRRTQQTCVLPIDRRRSGLGVCASLWWRAGRVGFRIGLRRD